MVTTSALPHNATKIQSSCPQRSSEALELRMADWKRFCLLTGETVKRLPPPDTSKDQILREHTRILARVYYLRLNNASHVAV